MSATTIAGGLDRLPRPRHLRLVATPGSELPPAGGPESGSCAGPKGRPGAVPVPGRPLRLTRRGRAVLLVVRGLAAVAAAAAAVLVGVALLGGSASADDAPVVPVSAVEHIVLPGETLWQIASTWAPGEDPRESVARLVEFNGLSGSGIVAGQELMLPRR